MPNFRTSASRLVAAALVLLAATSALADNSGKVFTLQIGNIQWSGSAGGYDCFSSTAYPCTVNFTITKNDNGNQNYAVTAGPSANTGTYTRQLRLCSSSLSYQLYVSSAMNYPLEAPPAATPGEVISGSSAHGTPKVIPLSFTFYVPPGQSVPAGTYTDTITFGVTDTYNDTRPYDTASVTLSVVVKASAAMSIVPTGNPFGGTSQTLDFGVLSAGAQMGCDVLIKKNNGCLVTYTSANAGALAGTAPNTDKVPYTISCFGIALNLAHGGNITLPTGPSAAPNGDRYPLTVSIGSFYVSADTYRDQVTFTVTAQ